MSRCAARPSTASSWSRWPRCSPTTWASPSPTERPPLRRDAQLDVSERDLVPGGAAVGGEEQLAGALLGVAVVDGRPAYHHAVGVGGEAQVRPAGAAVKLLVDDAPGRAAVGRVEQPACGALGGDGHVARRA